MVVFITVKDQMKAHMTIDSQILSRIYGKGRGQVFTPIDFTDLGDANTVRVILFRLTAKSIIRRLATGLYDYPEKHPELGLLLPKPNRVADALARGAGWRLQPAGAYAANLLGLSEQVPARVVFLTDGAGRKVSLKRLVIELRKAAPRQLALAGRMNGTVIQALRYLGKDHITPSRLATLRRVLSKADRSNLRRDAKFAPAWMRPHLYAVAADSPNA